MHYLIVWGHLAMQLLPHCTWVGGRVTLAMHCLIAWGQWAVEVLEYSALMPGDIGHRNSSNAMLHRLGAAGNATPTMHCHTSWG